MIKKNLVEKMNLVFSLVLEGTFEVYERLFGHGFFREKKKKEKESMLNNKNYKNYFLFSVLKYRKCGIFKKHF